MFKKWFISTRQWLLFNPGHLPADFPFSPVDSGKLYLKSLGCYIAGTTLPILLFYGLSEYAVDYDLPLAQLLFDEKNLYFVIAMVSVITFLCGFGAQLLYVRGQIRKSGRTISGVLSLNSKNFPGSGLQLVGCGIATFAVAAVLQQLAGLVWPVPVKDPTADLIGQMHGLSFGLMALLAVIAPIFEEIIFRGFLYGSLRASLHRRLPQPESAGYAWAVLRYDLLAAFVSALVFGLAHMNLAGLPLYVVTGMIFAEAYRRSGSLFVPMIGHFINNGLIMLVMFMMR